VKEQKKGQRQINKAWLSYFVTPTYHPFLGDLFRHLLGSLPHTMYNIDIIYPLVGKYKVKSI